MVDSVPFITSQLDTVHGVLKFFSQPLAQSLTDTNEDAPMTPSTNTAPESWARLAIDNCPHAAVKMCEHLADRQVIQQMISSLGESKEMGVQGGQDLLAQGSQLEAQLAQLTSELVTYRRMREMSNPNSRATD